jgi:GlpG protein
MRQLGTLPRVSDARAVADYLRTLRIETRLLPESDGWSVWVCDEDRVGQAREEFSRFQADPSDPRFAVRQAPAPAPARRELPTPRRVRRVPRAPAFPLTTSLIIACVVVFLLTAQGGVARSPLAQALFIAPFWSAGRALRPEGLSLILHGQVWRLVTPIFIHFSIWHLFFNMTWLWVLGMQIEARRGPWRLGLMIVAMAVASNLLQYYFGHLSLEGSELVAHPSPAFGGMSGVVYGLLGYVWMKARFDPEAGLWVQPSTIVWMMVWFALCWTDWFQQLVGPVANMAHAGGLLCGMLVGVLGTAARNLRESLRRD